MFVIRQQQLDAFRLPLREQMRDRALDGLRSDGLDVEPQADGRSFVCRDERGAATTLTYSDRVLPQTITKPQGQQYNLAYDTEGRLTTFQYPNKEQLTLTRDAGGLVTRLQTAPDTAFALAYQQNRLSRITYPDGAMRQFGYNAGGLLTTLTDRTGHTRQYIRDELDGKLLAVVDEQGHSTQFVFEDGRLAGIVFPDGTQQTVAYDEHDDSLFITLRDGKGFVQQYDGDFISELNWEHGPWTRFVNDTDGRPKTIQTPNSLVSFGYGDRGLTSEQGLLGTTQLSYDKTGQLAGVQLPAGPLVQYGYNLNDRLSHIDVNGQRIVYRYDAHDLLTGIDYPNGLHQDVAQQHLGGLQHTRLTDKHGRVLHQQRYEYDTQQRLRTIADEKTQQNRQLFYDAESRLLAVADADNPAKPTGERFQYSPAGSLSDINGYRVETGPMGEIRAVGRDRWQYDALGNVTQLRGPRGLMDLNFARNGTLSQLRVNGQTWQYTYDGLGRRISKTNGAETWQFAWLEGRLVAETYQLAPNVPALARHYVYHPDSFTPVGFWEADQLFTLLADTRGAVTHAFNAQGQIVWQGDYSAYGTCKEVVSQVRQSLRLAGQWADAESGLHYNVGRYYAPFVGQYLSLDPRWLDHLDTHPYSYARSDPYGRHDPLGDIAPLVIIGGAALIGGIVSGGITAWQGGSWRQIGASAAHGALSGAGMAAGAMLGGIPGLMAGAGAGGFLGSLAEQAINGEKLCFGCAAKEGLIEGLFAGAFGLAGKVLGPALGRLGRAVASSRMGQAISRAASRALAGAKNGLRRAGQAIRNRLGSAGRRAIPYKPGWSRERVLAIPKGQRPPPSEYLDQKYIDEHLAQFDKGGSYLTPKEALDRFGRDRLGRPDGVFIKTKAEMDDLLRRANGDISVIEKEIGIPEGGWKGKEMVRIDVPDPRQNGMRLPSGNEEGANDLWIPGGKLPSGDLEGVLNQIPKGSYNETPIILN